MNEIPTVEDVTLLVQLVPSEVLVQLIVALDPNNQDDTYEGIDFQDEFLATMLHSLAVQEYHLRRIEPVSRKLTRFAMRNSAKLKEAGKIAAAIGVGVLCGSGIGS